MKKDFTYYGLYVFTLIMTQDNIGTTRPAVKWVLMNMKIEKMRYWKMRVKPKIEKKILRLSFFYGFPNTSCCSYSTHVLKHYISKKKTNSLYNKLASLF